MGQAQVISGRSGRVEPPFVRAERAAVAALEKEGFELVQWHHPDDPYALVDIRMRKDGVEHWFEVRSSDDGDRPAILFRKMARLIEAHRQNPRLHVVAAWTHGPSVRLERVPFERLALATSSFRLSPSARRLLVGHLHPARARQTVLPGSEGASGPDQA